MIKRSTGTLGLRELSALIFIMISIKGVDMTPAHLFKNGLSATWMFPFIWLLVMVIPFFAILSLVKKYKDKNLIEIIYQLTGKYIGFVISMYLFISLFSASITNSRGYIDILSARYYLLTPIIVLYGLLIFTSYFIAKRGLEAIGRSSFLTLPYLIIIMIILFILIFDDINLDFLFPILGPGLKEIAINGIETSSLIGEFLLFAVFFPYAKDYKTYRNANLIGLIAGCLFVSLMLFEYVAVFDYTAPQKMLHAFSQLTRYTDVPIFINNLDAIYLGAWILAGMIRFAFYLYGSAAILAYALKLKEFEPLILPLALLTITLGLIPDNPAITLFLLRGNYLIRLSWIGFALIPLILWGISKFKDVKQSEKS